MGAGKTTVQSAFMWLLYDKNVEQKKQFEARPLDANNQQVRGLIVSVTATLSVDGRDVTLKKEEHERIVKDQIKGYTRRYFVDEVPKSEGEYKQYVESLVREDTARILTDLKWFCEGMHWSERRAVLNEMIRDKVGMPQGFDDLIDRLKGRSVEDYRKVLANQRKLIEERRNQIPVRMNEVKRRFESSQVDDEDDRGVLLEARDLERKAMDDLVKKRAELVKSEQSRGSLIAKREAVELSRHRREMELCSKAIEAFNADKDALRMAMAKEQTELVQLGQDATRASLEVNSLVNNVRYLQSDLDKARQRWKTVSETSLVTQCYNCKQELPESMLEANKQGRAKSLAEAENSARELKAKVVAAKAEVEKAKEAKDTLDSELLQRKTEHVENETRWRRELQEIDARIANAMKPDFTTDDEWAGLTDEIDKLKAQIGPSIHEQIEQIERDARKAQEEGWRLDKLLSSYDERQKDKARLEELQTELQTAAQEVANIDRELDELAAYKVQESLDIEAAANDLFDGIEWKLFDYRFNGETDDQRCDATCHGVPFSDLSTGEQIRCGAAVVKALSKHYDCRMPLFIDHAESVTLPIDADTQIILLQFDDTLKELTVTRLK